MVSDIRQQMVVATAWMIKLRDAPYMEELAQELETWIADVTLFISPLEQVVANPPEVTDWRTQLDPMMNMFSEFHRSFAKMRQPMERFIAHETEEQGEADDEPIVVEDDDSPAP